MYRPLLKIVRYKTYENSLCWSFPWWGWIETKIILKRWVKHLNTYNSSYNIDKEIHNNESTSVNHLHHLNLLCHTSLKWCWKQFSLYQKAVQQNHWQYQQCTLSLYKPVGPMEWHHRTLSDGMLAVRRSQTSHDQLLIPVYKVHYGHHGQHLCGACME